jgi:O-antigen/teichoic acid export membrane protein
MPKLADNSRLVSPRARFYLVIGTTALALLVLVYAVVFEHGSAKTFIESIPAWLVLLLAALVATFSGWRQAKDQRLGAGLLAKSIGKGLFLAGAVALLTKLPSPLVWSCFVLGIVSSAVGTAQFFSSRRKAATQPPKEKEGGVPLKP